MDFNNTSKNKTSTKSLLTFILYTIKWKYTNIASHNLISLMFVQSSKQKRREKQKQISCFNSSNVKSGLFYDFYIFKKMKSNLNSRKQTEHSDKQGEYDCRCNGCGWWWKNIKSHHHSESQKYCLICTTKSIKNIRSKSIFNCDIWWFCSNTFSTHTHTHTTFNS